MFFNHKTNSSTAPSLADLAKLHDWITQADAVVIGAGAGLSTSAGLQYGGERFQALFPDYIAHYGLTDMYSAAFYPFPTREAYWAYFSKHIYHNRYDFTDNGCYADLLHLVQDKKYFVITTNADHLFIKNGFDKERLFYTQGDYGLFQCSVPCHAQTYDNREAILAIVEQQHNFEIPTNLLPTCPRCGAPMEVNLRKDDTFVEDAGWKLASQRYMNFLQQHAQGNILFLELGIGYNTPGIIKYPFWRMTYQNKQARYINMNLAKETCPVEIAKQSLYLQGDIADILGKLSNML